MEILCLRGESFGDAAKASFGRPHCSIQKLGERWKQESWEPAPPLTAKDACQPFFYLVSNLSGATTGAVIAVKSLLSMTPGFVPSFPRGRPPFWV